MAARSKERERKILECFWNAALISKDTSSITVVLKGSTTLLRHREYVGTDFLRLNVNRDYLLAQLEEWV